MSEPTFPGGQCGVIRYEAKDPPLVMALCHCSTCRRASAAPVLAWVTFRQEDVRFGQGQPKQQGG